MRRSKRVTVAAGLFSLVAGLMLVVAGAATADHGYEGNASSHVLVQGNPRCPEGTADAGSTKIESNQLNTSYNDGRIAITARGGDPDAFSWRLVNDDVDIEAVIVKGGDNAYIYFYNVSPLDDAGLTPPLNGGGQAPAISHVEFCFDPKDTPDPELTVEKSASGTSRVQHSWEIDKQVKLAGASDATYGDNATLNLADGGSGSVTWKVVVTHSQTQSYAVTGTITVSNSGAVAVTGVDVSDSIPGAAISCAGGGSTGITVPANGSVQCSYSVAPGSQVANNTATATWGTDNSAADTATIEWSTTEVGVPASVEDGGEIDESLGLDDLEGNTWTETYDEDWTCRSGTPSPNGGRTNTATVTWDGGSDSDSASVQVGCGSTPPPPPPPPPPPTVKTDEFMDVEVAKDATQQVQLVNGQANIAYTVKVRNNGPNQAHNVVLVDAAPSGVTFLAVTQQPVNGNCTVTAALLNCTLGTLGPGVERTIGLSARVTQTGTYVNCATGTGQGKDTNGANNMDCASTLVTAPVTPPTPPTSKPKPKPKPKPVDICRVLKVTPAMVKANGKTQLVVAKVTRARNPVKGVVVRFAGAGEAKVLRTNAKGVAQYRVKPGKAGIMLVKITSAKACNSARIGVVGVFEPPVTG